MSTKLSPCTLYLIPVIWFILGVLYARSLESWAGIGIMILVLVSTGGILIGTITWHITRKLLYSIGAVIIAATVFFTIIVVLARLGV